MSLHIVIDGYNLIRQSNQLSVLDQQALQAGRDRLVDLLAAYKKFKAHKITVVFDGGQAPVGLPRSERVKGIDVRYSRRGELADALIKRIAARERERVLVVSSDAQVAGYAAAKGAATIAAAEFEERLFMAQYEDQKATGQKEEAVGWQPTTRKKGPARRLPKKQRKARMKRSKL
jgi:predicted RNA-binding protein with PIN domain